jgi:hypothetical protein
VWTDSDNIWQEITNWKRLWASGRPGRDVVMDEDEREALAAMPDEITVYRGTTNKKGIRGLSWTLDRDQAVWFARRYTQIKNGNGVLTTGTVQKKDVMAYFTGRNEQEIVALPTKIVGYSSKPI